MGESNQEAAAGAQTPPAARSPSPSTLSTASSGSPLIRGNSSTSSAASNEPAKASGERPSGLAAGAASRRPAPTSIAAAQLCQQQQLAGKLPQANKLAHMTLAQQAALVAEGQQMSYQLGAGGKAQQMPASANKNSAWDKSKLAAPTGADSRRGFGYNLGKLIAYKATR